MAGLLKAITTIFCFIFVLWSLSEPLTLPLPGLTIHIYGYLVWTALAYSVIGTWITHKVGHKLVGLNFVQQKLEADFRYAMVRLRETSESVAFYHGGKEEKKILSGRFHKLLVNTVYIIRKQKQLSWLTNSYGQIAIIFPFVVAAPRYLSKNISLGGLMQVANCFGKVQESMSYFVDVYSSLAEWMSCVERLLTFDAHMDHMLRETEKEQGHLARKEGSPALILSDVTVRLPGGKTLLSSLSCTTISLHKGETLGIVGESGSGKSTLAKILTRLYTMDSGRILLHGKDMTALKGEEFRQARKNIQMVFQDPSTAFDPKQRVRDIICEPLMNYGLIGKEKVDEKAREMLRLVDLPEEFADRYPNSMSGGQRQRIAVARALVLKPEIIICDEATSALDMSVQKTVIELLHRLQLETGVSYFFICHDLALANMFCDNIVVMQHGRVVEKIKDLSEAKDPYSKKLLASVFTIEEGKNKVLPDELFG